MLFTPKRHKCKDEPLNLSFLDQTIVEETSFKYFGVVFDNYTYHRSITQLTSVCKKVATRIGVLGRVRGFITMKAA